MNSRLCSLLRNAGILSLYAGLTATTAITAVYAQAVPTAVDPSQLEKRFERPERQLPAAVIKTLNPPPSQVPSALQQQMAKKRFMLKRAVVEGNTVFTDEQLQFAYKDMLGKEISLVDAQTIVKRITDHYRSNDYILSQAIVPPQDVTGGTLRIRVVEGFINNVIIQGDIKGSKAKEKLEAYASHIKGKRPIKISDMERYLLLMDDLPGATARGVVRPSPNMLGAADLVVTLEHKTYEASYTVDNRGSKAVGPFQHSATFAANSIFGLYDRTLLRAITTSPTTELRFIDLQHEEQIGDEGTRLVLTGSYSHAEPGDSLKALDLRSDSSFFQGKLLHPFQRSRRENLVGRVILDARNSETDIFATTNLSKDRLRVARVGGNVDFADSLGGVNLFDGEISKGLGVFGATDENDNQSRGNAEDDFVKFNLDYTRTQPLRGAFSLFMAATAQYTPDRLLAAEQFTIGGPVFGRAYDPAEVGGDYGVAGKIELRYGQALLDPYLNSYQLYGFYDVGMARLNDGGAGANQNISLASAGVGVRTNFSRNLSGYFEVADPLTKPASNQGGHANSPRIFFSMTGRF
jgi:hemolysin activation/secretion protein